MKELRLTQFGRIVVNLPIAIFIFWAANLLHPIKADRSFDWGVSLIYITMNTVMWFYFFQAFDAGKKLYKTAKDNRETNKKKLAKEKLSKGIVELTFTLSSIQLQRTQLELKLEETLKQDFTESQKEEWINSFLEETNKLDSVIEKLKRTIQSLETTRHQINFLDDLFSPTRLNSVTNLYNTYNINVEATAMRASLIHDALENELQVVQINMEMSQNDVMARINAMHNIIDDSGSDEI